MGLSTRQIGAEDHRQQGQAHPQPDVDHVRHGVVGVVLAAQERQQGPGRQGERERAEQPPHCRAVQGEGQPGTAGAGRRSGEARLLPQQRRARGRRRPVPARPRSAAGRTAGGGPRASRRRGPAAARSPGRSFATATISRRSRSLVGLHLVEPGCLPVRGTVVGGACQQLRLDLEAVGVELVVVVAGHDQSQRLADLRGPPWPEPGSTLLPCDRDRDRPALRCVASGRGESWGSWRRVGVVATAELEAVEPLEWRTAPRRPPPQAVTVSARPAATAYRPCLDGVIFVTHAQSRQRFLTRWSACLTA